MKKAKLIPISIRWFMTLEDAKTQHLDGRELLYQGKLQDCPKELLDQSQINTSFKYINVWNRPNYHP